MDEYFIYLMQGGIYLYDVPLKTKLGEIVV